MGYIQTAGWFVRKKSMMKTIKLFNRDFSKVVIGQIISLFGNAILRFASPLYLLRETNSSVLFGAVTACSFIHMVVFSLLGGVTADRKNKRKIMAVLDFFTAFIIILFYIILGKLPLVPLMIVTLILLYGISGAYQPSVQASIPLLINSENLVRGMLSLTWLTRFQVCWILPLVVRYFKLLVYHQYSSFVLFAFHSGSYGNFYTYSASKKQGQSIMIKTLFYDLKEGYPFIKSEKPVYISVVIVLALFNLVLSAAMIVGLPVMVRQILDMSDTNVGIAQSALGLGELVGGIALVEMIPEVIGFGITTGMNFVTMCVSTIFIITLFAAIQRQTPSHLLRKIMAVIIAVANCSQPIGQVLYGIVFDSYKHIPWAILGVSAVPALFISIYLKRVFVKLETGEQHVVNKNLSK